MLLLFFSVNTKGEFNYLATSLYNQLEFIVTSASKSKKDIINTTKVAHSRLILVLTQ